MNYRPLLLIAALLTGIVPARAALDAVAFSNLKLSQLEQRLTEIDAEIGKLAHFSVRSGIGSIGYRSMWHNTADHPEWVQIELGQEHPIDKVVLVPTLWRETTTGFRSDAFPETFRIIAGNHKTPDGSVITEFKTSSHDLPRIAPMVIPVNGITASWIRIEVPYLPSRAFDNMHVFQLAEVMIFSGEENVALRRPVSASSMEPKLVVRAWDQKFLTDGHMPYVMHAASGKQSIAYVSRAGQKQVLQLDLKEATPISHIQLHATDHGGTAPQAHTINPGLPRTLLIEGASQPDFSDAKILLDRVKKRFSDTGPIMMWSIPETVCRYIRISDANPTPASRIGFAEIALFSKDRNIALGKPVTATPPNQALDPHRQLNTLTDGSNQFGKILSIRDWVEQLAYRHDLETERPLVATELNLRYIRQKANLQRLSWLSALLVAAVVFTILIDRMLRQRHITKLRERFAADLHDELGANLHAIGLLGDVAKKVVYAPDKLIETVDEIRTLTERSGKAARHCADMQQAYIFNNLPEDMRRTARRIMADVDYDISIEGEAALEKLKPRTRSDLFLFYKECLVNISRHSEANAVRINLTASIKDICLTIIDNGHGLEGEVPTSLKRRARLLGGKPILSTSESGGTYITLRFKPRKFGIRR